MLLRSYLPVIVFAGLGVIVGATLAGYDATPDNTANLVALARMQSVAVKRALGPSGRR